MPIEQRGLALEPLEQRRLLSVDPLLSGGTTSQATAAQNTQVAAAYAQIPMSFEPNVGQTAAQVNYLSHGDGYSLFLMPNEAVLGLTQTTTDASGKPAPGNSATLTMQIVGASASAQPTGLDLQASKSNYLIGNDASQWHTNVANYGRVQYRDVYSGIGLVYYGNQRQLEYDFSVAPGADPRAIDLAFSGATNVSVDADGSLVLATASGKVVEHAPQVYQQTAAGRQAVSAHYEIRSDGSVGISVGSYDATQPLVIDPVLSYSTYLGGSSGDEGFGIAVDGSGDAYVTGYTGS
ncbi:MAG TPA: SBBP repeat-containing protein, partial [Pirellulales bacterium]|nr:SBBP repeat-containing protein [Pirellulales bacterium]